MTIILGTFLTLAFGSCLITAARATRRHREAEAAMRHWLDACIERDKELAAMARVLKAVGNRPEVEVLAMIEKLRAVGVLK